MECFPFKEIRPEQKRILEWVHPLLEDDKIKNIVIEAGTGVGKSAIAKAISKYCGSSYVLTSTKALQDQYYKDFRDMDAEMMKGKVAYKCIHSDVTCDKARCVQISKTKSITNNSKISLFASETKYEECFNSRSYTCPYYLQLQKAINAEMFITSYAYFFSNYNVPGPNNTKRIDERNVLILDECHLLDDMLIDYLRVTINKKKIDEKYNLVKDMTLKERISWAKQFDNTPENDIRAIELLKYVLSNKVEKLEKNLIDKYGGNTAITPEKRDEIKEILEEQSGITKLKTRIEFFLKEYKKFKDEWIVYSDLETQTFHAIPISSSKAFSNFVDKKAKKRVFMSATIFGQDMICKELGLNPEETRYINVGSTFPPKQSPIVIAPVANFKYPNYAEAANKSTQVIEMLFQYHKKHKGVIHTSSYQISNLILDRLSKESRKRIITRTQSENNEVLISKHIKSKSPTVLMSPSIMSGVDLKDDLARFQIILRLPYLSISDPRIKHISKTDFTWYAKKMLRELVQATGRATRSEDDWSVTYILDSRFNSVLNRYQRCLSNSFKNRLVIAKDFNIQKFLENK
jgi:Rad3-related DNA helicase